MFKYKEPNFDNYSNTPWNTETRVNCLLCKRIFDSEYWNGVVCDECDEENMGE